MYIFPNSSYKPFSNSFVVDTSSFQTKVQTTRSCWSSISAWASKKSKAVLPSPQWKEFGSTKKRCFFCPVSNVAIGVISYQVLICKAVFRCYNSIYHWFYKPTLLGLKGFQFEGWSMRSLVNEFIQFVSSFWTADIWYRFFLQQHINNNHICRRHAMVCYDGSVHDKRMEW